MRYAPLDCNLAPGAGGDGNNCRACRSTRRPGRFFPAGFPHLPGLPGIAVVPEPAMEGLCAIRWAHSNGVTAAGLAGEIS